MPTRFQPGQRWISDSEPELGLGEVRALSPRTVTLWFGASEETREYRLESAPLRRATFRPGETLRNAQGEAWIVDSVSEREGLFYYACGASEVCETTLSSALSSGGPQERFQGGRFDSPELFGLRFAAQKHQYRSRKSQVRGFLGGRIDLLPHQLSIASEVASRLQPRVLLADEVGLGKTIEACLILHRLLLTGRARRVLILVPESLLHQWFLELLRRFNLWFHIYDEARCGAYPGANPFLDDQLVLCPLSLFTAQAGRLQQALEAGWDLLVVDEAHHLGWPSPEYATVEALGSQTPGLLLLTATPEQLGLASHFARLRLLDPERFFDLEAFIQESEGYREIAHLAEKLKGAQELSAAELEGLSRVLGTPASTLGPQIAQSTPGKGIRKAWIDALLDQHGTGRVMFRNTRATIAGFPQRVPLLHPLESQDAHSWKALAREGAEASQDPKAFRPDFTQDPRIPWLAELLHNLGQDKVLLICRTQAKAEAIEAALKKHLRVKMTVFHEGLTLIQRDRGAAWFAEKDGARLLICSEIGSEGRNFQFAHHLVLFDLPLDPALLEQRIGRLDRIGQAAPIQVHVPFVRGSHQEVLARWYQDGLNAFAENLPGGRELLERFEPRIRALALHFHEDPPASQTQLQRLVADTQEARKALTARLEQGRDRLLEWNSYRPEVAAGLIGEIGRQDAPGALDGFLLAIFELFAVEVEELAPRTYQLGSAGVLVDAFPGLGSEGLTVTCDRARALAREDLQFLTWDHPMVTGALDLMLGSDHGNSSFALWPDAQASGLYLEAIYMLECVAPAHFQLDRFLPPTPLRVMVDHRGRDVGKALPHGALGRLLRAGEGSGLAPGMMARPEIREVLLPRLMDQTKALAELRVREIIALARQDMSLHLDHEIARLRELRRVNRSVREPEIELLVQQRRALDQHIGAARLRLDALRLIHRGFIR